MCTNTNAHALKISQICSKRKTREQTEVAIYNGLYRDNCTIEYTRHSTQKEKKNTKNNTTPKMKG
jgi:hypothetical protein